LFWSGLSRGRACCGRLSLRLSVGAIAIDADDPTAGTTEIGSSENLSTIDRLAVCAAALEAQDLFGCLTHDHAGLGDYVKMSEVIGKNIPEKESRALRDAGHARARELILIHMDKVVRLAERLADAGHIAPLELATLLED
jgi:hypothetical protein